MSSPPVMSTPISNIPIQLSQNIPIDEDPEVTAILQEMQQSIPQQAVIQQHAIPQARYAAPPTYVQQQNVPMGIVTFSKPLFHTETAQRALYAALIAYLLFYPKTLEIVYSKFPMMEKFQSYDMIIRFFLLAVVLYGLMWKFNL